MNDQKRKSLDEFSDESEQFERQFERLPTGEGDESARARLITEITGWLQDCAKQGSFIPLASADRRAFRSLLERWNSRLRHQRVDVEGIDCLADFDPSAGIVLTGECPYPGLEPYTQRRRGSFFGREALVSSSVAHLEQQGNRILLLIGASGSGKSSLALAGILPRLTELHDGAWLFGPPLTPGVHPLPELAASVAQSIGHPDQASEIERGLSAKPSEALGQLAELCQDKPFMLLVDQFEELLTLCGDAGEQCAFAQVLYALSDPAASSGSFCCRILLTLRTDHLARFESNNALKPLHMRLVGECNERYLSAIGFSDIKRAIKGPAEEVGLRFIPAALIDQLASETAGLSNGLPLLQFALRRLWDTRPTNELEEPLDLITEEMVKTLPDVERSLGTVAEDLFRTFSQSQQQICERLLLELVVLDESFEEPLRRRRNEAGLRGVLQERFRSSEDVARVIGDFVAAGLLRRFGEGPDSQLEVAHEALLRHWDHIYHMVTGAEVKERLLLIKQIGREAGEWVGRGRTDGYLNLRGERLRRALIYAEDGWLAEPASREYVEACGSRQAAERLIEQRAKEAERYRRYFWPLAVLAAIALALIGWRTEAQRARDARHSDALRLALLAHDNMDVDPERSLILAVNAASATYRTDRAITLEAENAIRETAHVARVKSNLLGHTDTINSITFSRDGTLLATASDDATIKLWGTNSGRLLGTLTGHTNGVYLVSFDSNGERVASAGLDDKLKIWDVSSGRLLLSINLGSAFIADLSFSQDGRYVLGAMSNETVTEWDSSSGEAVPVSAEQAEKLGDASFQFARQARSGWEASRDVKLTLLDSSSGEALHTLAGSVPLSVKAISPGSHRWLATTDAAGAVTIWDSSSLTTSHTLPNRQGSLTRVIFSPDGSQLATLGEDGSLILWESASGRLLYTLSRQANQITVVVFSWNGTLLAAGNDNGTVKVWDLSPARDSVALADFGGAIGPPVLSQDGLYVAARPSRLGGKKTRIWNTFSGGPPIKLSGETPDVSLMTFSPDGSSIALADRTGTVSVWKTSSGEFRYRLGGGSGSQLGKLTVIAFTREQNLVTVTADGVLRLWNAASGTLSPNQPANPDAANFLTAAVSTKGDRWALVKKDGSIVVSDTASGKEIYKVSREQAGASSVYFSPEGGLFVTYGTDKGLLLWRADSGKLLKTLSDEPSNEYRCLAFAPDSTKLVASTADAAIKIWELPSGRILHSFSLGGSELGISALSFTDDASQLVVARFNGEVETQPLYEEDLLKLAQNRITRPLVSAECREYHIEGAQCEVAGLVEDAYKLARTGEIGDAETKFKLAKRVDQMHEVVLDPTVEAKRLAARKYAEDANTSARAGGLENAVAAFRKTKEIYPDTSLDPEERARYLVGQFHINEGIRFSEASDAAEALAEFREAIKVDPSLGRHAYYFNHLCWFGSVLRHAPEVIADCETAVKLEPANLQIRDSRGLARALTGNRSGAIEDFIALIGSTSATKEQKDKRREWVKALRAGKDPFKRDAVLESLLFENSSSE